MTNSSRRVRNALSLLLGYLDELGMSRAVADSEEVSDLQRRRRQGCQVMF